MANNERWRDDQDRFRYRDENEDWMRGEGGQEYRRGGRRESWGGGFGQAGRGAGDMTGGAFGRDHRDSMSDRERGGRGYGGGGYGAERYGRSYEPETRGSGDFSGNDYNRGFYGADQGWGGRERGPHQDVWGYRGERSGWDRATDEMASWFGDDDAARRREQDARQGDQGAQHHRGRGPRGYRRSDDRILEDVNDRLTDDPFVDASNIEVSVSNSEVTLSGTVDSRDAKRRAEDIAERIAGVTHVQNNLRVQQQGIGQGAAAGAMGATGGTSGTGGAGGTSGGAATGAAGATGTQSTAATTGTTRRRTIAET